jgi:hypothetical protein
MPAERYAAFDRDGRRIAAVRTAIEDDVEPGSAPPANPVADCLRRVIGELLAATNKPLEIECFALVTAIAYDGSSEAEIARRYAVSRQAVSRRCIEIREAMGGIPSMAMRGDRNRARCRASRAARLTRLEP